MYKCTVYNILDAHKEERAIQDRYFSISFCQWGYRLWKKWFVAGGWNCLRSDESNVRLWKAIRCCTLRRSMELAIGCSAVIETLSMLQKYGNIRYWNLISFLYCSLYDSESFILWIISSAYYVDDIKRRIVRWLFWFYRFLIKNIFHRTWEYCKKSN